MQPRVIASSSQKIRCLRPSAHGLVRRRIGMSRAPRTYGPSGVHCHEGFAMLHRPLIDAERWDEQADVDTSRFLPRVQSIAEGLDRTSPGLAHVVGQSAPWKEVLNDATHVAATQAT